MKQTVDDNNMTVTKTENNTEMLQKLQSVANVNQNAVQGLKIRGNIFPESLAAFLTKCGSAGPMIYQKRHGTRVYKLHG